MTDTAPLTDALKYELRYLDTRSAENDPNVSYYALTHPTGEIELLRVQASMDAAQILRPGADPVRSPGPTEVLRAGYYPLEFTASHESLGLFAFRSTTDKGYDGEFKLQGSGTYDSVTITPPGLAPGVRLISGVMGMQDGTQLRVRILAIRRYRGWHLLADANGAEVLNGQHRLYRFWADPFTWPVELKVADHMAVVVAEGEAPYGLMTGGTRAVRLGHATYTLDRQTWLGINLKNPSQFSIVPMTPMSGKDYTAPNKSSVLHFAPPKRVTHILYPTHDHVKSRRNLSHLIGSPEGAATLTASGIKRVRHGDNPVEGTDITLTLTVGGEARTKVLPRPGDQYGVYPDWICKLAVTGQDGHTYLLPMRANHEGRFIASPYLPVLLDQVDPDWSTLRHATDEDVQATEVPLRPQRNLLVLGAPQAVIPNVQVEPGEFPTTVNLIVTDPKEDSTREVAAYVQHGSGRSGYSGTLDTVGLPCADWKRGDRVVRAVWMATSAPRQQLWAVPTEATRSRYVTVDDTVTSQLGERDLALLRAQHTTRRDVEIVIEIPDPNTSYRVLTIGGDTRSVHMYGDHYSRDRLCVATHTDSGRPGPNVILRVKDEAGTVVLSDDNLTQLNHGGETLHVSGWATLPGLKKAAWEVGHRRLKLDDETGPESPLRLRAALRTLWEFAGGVEAGVMLDDGTAIEGIDTEDGLVGLLARLWVGGPLLATAIWKPGDPTRPVHAEFGQIRPATQGEIPEKMQAAVAARWDNAKHRHLLRGIVYEVHGVAIHSVQDGKVNLFHGSMEAK